MTRILRPERLSEQTFLWEVDRDSFDESDEFSDFAGPLGLPQHIAQAAAVWRECGLRRNEPVAIRLSQGLESVTASLGAASAGGVPVAVDPALPAHEWQRLWSGARWRFILTESRAEQPAAMRDSILTLNEWRLALAQAQPFTAGFARSGSP